MKKKTIEIYPTQKQASQIDATIKACQEVRNYFIDIYRECYNAEHPISFPSKNELRKILTYIRNNKPISNMEFKAKDKNSVPKELRLDAKAYNVAIKEAIKRAEKNFYLKDSTKISDSESFSKLLKQSSRNALETTVNHLISEYVRFVTRNKKGSLKAGAYSHPRYKYDKREFAIDRLNAVKTKSGKLFIPQIRYIDLSEPFAEEVEIKRCEIKKRKRKYYATLEYTPKE